MLSLSEINKSVRRTMIGDRHARSETLYFSNLKIKPLVYKYKYPSTIQYSINNVFLICNIFFVLFVRFIFSTDLFTNPGIQVLPKQIVEPILVQLSRRENTYITYIQTRQIWRFRWHSDVSDQTCRSPIRKVSDNDKTFCELANNYVHLIVWILNLFNPNKKDELWPNPLVFCLNLLLKYKSKCLNSVLLMKV